MIVYNNLFDLLEKNNLKKGMLQTKIGLSGATYAKITKNEPITTKSIDKICAFFTCTPNDIMEYIPDGTYEEYYKQREIKKLQDKLTELNK